MRFFIGSFDKIMKGAAVRALDGAPYGIADTGTHLAVEADAGAVKDIAARLSRELGAMLLQLYLKTAVFRNYAFLSAEHRELVAARALARIRSSAFYPEQMNAVHDRIALCLMERRVFNIDGFMRFRMNDISEKWAGMLEAEVSFFLRENERAELLRMLKRFAASRPPVAKKITVKDEGLKYAFFAGDGTRIVAVFTSGKYTRDEELINTLLYLSPEEIVLEGVEDEDIKAVLKEIFGSRVKG